MASYPRWNEWKQRRGSTGPVVFENKGQRPSYSFDNWLKMTQELGDEMSSFVAQSKEKDQELDDELKKKKKEPPKPEKDEDEDKDEEKQHAWKRLRDIAKERREAQEKKDGAKKSSAKSSASR